ncbi:MAG: hypothetical protein IPK85_00560 [Gemmatimonadetes bacterium]|nr:hypothetical protein [Gemmatimonadota bacterium]
MRLSAILALATLSVLVHPLAAQDLGDMDSFGRSPLATQDSVAIQLEGDGAGVVASWPSGLACRAARCEGAFPAATTLTLSATPAAGSHFVGWTGVCAGLQRCVVRLEEARTVRALFRSGPRVLPSR